MAFYSQNGRTVLPGYGGILVANAIPGSGAKYLGGLLPDVDVVARYCGSRWHQEIEPVIQAQGQWGYNLRAIRGQTTGYSNHSSATAWDTNAAKHPLDTHTLSTGQKQVLQRIMSACGGVVRAGAFYTGRVDEMHLEIVGTDSDLAALVSIISHGKLPNTPPELITTRPVVIGKQQPSTAAPVSAPTAPTSLEDDDLTDEEKARLKNIEQILAGLQNAVSDPGNGIFVNAAGARGNAADAKASADNGASIASEIRNWILDPTVGVLAAIGRLSASQIAASIPDHLAADVATELSTRLAS